MKAFAAFVGTVVAFAAFAPSALGGLTDAASTDAAAPVTQTVTNTTAPTTTAAAPVLQTANTTAAPLTDAAAPVTQTVTTTAVPLTAAAAPAVQTVTTTAAPAVATVTTAVSAAAPVSERVTPIAATADRLTPTAQRRDEVTTVQSPVATAVSGSTDARTPVSVAPAAGQGSTKTAPPVARRAQQQPTGTLVPASTPDTLIATSSPTTDTHGAREPRAQAPDSPLPGLPLRDTIPGLAGTLSAAASSGSVAFFAALLTLFIIAIPSVGRWLRPALDVARPSGFVSPIEVPG